LEEEILRKEIVYTTKAPHPIGPYSQATTYNDVLYVSGQGPSLPGNKGIIKGSIEEEARLALTNLKTIAEEAGYELDGALKVTCFLSNMDDFAGFNKVYGEFFSKLSPARTTVQAARLPMGIKVEIDAIIGRIMADKK
jgi:2-iminobutanoate/2-iminopropanoate deaminase